MTRRRPGEVRDAIVGVLEGRREAASVQEIRGEVSRLIGTVSASSVRSYLQLNTPVLFARTDRGQYVLSGFDAPADLPAARGEAASAEWSHGRARLVLADCNDWLSAQSANSIHAVVTDPPYGLVEYSDSEQRKLRSGRGGVWRIPPELRRFQACASAAIHGIEGR